MQGTTRGLLRCPDDSFENISKVRKYFTLILQVHLPLPPGRQEDRGAGEATAPVPWSHAGGGGRGKMSQ